MSNVDKSAFLNLRPVLGYFNWAQTVCLLGGRQAGKSYAVGNYFVDSYVNKDIPYTWLRLTDKQANKLLQNNAELLVDPDIRRKYNLDIVTSGSNVYNVIRRSAPDKNGKTKILEKKLMARVFALSNFYNQKGSGLYDKDFLSDLSMQHHIVLDEFEKEENEKSQGDLLYQFVNQIENLIRNDKERVKIFIIGNMLETCSDILTGLNFLPEDFGIYKLKKKRTVIFYMPPTDAYKQMRKGSFADLWMPEASTFTNMINKAKLNLFCGRLQVPKYVVKFTKNKSEWFTVWDDGIVAPYKNEKVYSIAMSPHIGEFFQPEPRDNIFVLFDTRQYAFVNRLTAVKFEKFLDYIKPRGK